MYIYGGTVNATGTGGSAGIGGGRGTATNGSGGSVYIYGGTVNATGGNNSAMGIGAAAGGSSNGTLILGEGLALQNKNGDTWTNVENTGTEDAPVYVSARNMRTAKKLAVGQYIAVGHRVYTDDMITSNSESCPHCFPENTSTVDSVIYEDNFYEVWEKRFRPFRDRSWTKTGPCASCSSWKDCLGNGMHNWHGTPPALLQCHHAHLK